MASTIETLENKQIKLTITVNQKDFEAGMQKAYMKIRKDVMVPGFRKGKVPRQVIKNYYGAEVFYEDAFQEVFPGSYENAIKEHNVQDVERPDVDVVEIGKGQGVIYTAVVTVKPEVTLKEYKGKSVSVYKKTIAEEDVQTSLNKDAEQIARIVEVTDRAAEKDDRVTIDYVGTTGGAAFEGGSAEGYELELGSNSFIPGFEEQVVGMNINDTKDINVTFPEEYHSDELKGKDAVFNVKLNSIKTKELPEIDDEFAKDVSEFDTLDEYKADIKAKLEKTVEEQFDSESQNKIVELLVESMEVEVPECMVESQIDYMLRELEYNFQNQGFPLDQYMQMTGMTTEKLREQYKEQAMEHVKAQLALETVQKAENIEVTDEDVEAELVKMSEEKGTELEELKKTFAGPNSSYIKDSLLSTKTMDFLKEHVTVKVSKKPIETKEK